MNLTSTFKALLILALALPMSGFSSAGLSQGLATVNVEENVRSEPRGVILGQFPAGSLLEVLDIGDQWVQVRFEGWVWTQSLQATDRLGFDLVVSEDPAENLRAEPSGTILGRLVRGTLLERIGSEPSWTRVERTGWIWSESVELDAAALAEGGSEVPQGVRGGSGAPEGLVRTGVAGMPVLSGPDGDTLARVRPGTDLRILAREGSWARVSLEGWSWIPQTDTTQAAGQAPVADLTVEDVLGNPDIHRGRVVSWNLQFVSLESAEAVRTDFFEGEPFLLTRTTTSGSGFVYVAVPPDRLPDVEGLIPLERIRIVGRIRTGSAALTGNPILDLLEITRVSRN